MFFLQLLDDDLHLGYDSLSTFDLGLEIGHDPVLAPLYFGQGVGQVLLVFLVVSGQLLELVGCVLLEDSDSGVKVSLGYLLSLQLELDVFVVVEQLVESIVQV